MRLGNQKAVFYNDGTISNWKFVQTQLLRGSDETIFKFFVLEFDYVTYWLENLCPLE